MPKRDLLDLGERSQPADHALVARIRAAITAPILVPFELPTGATGAQFADALGVVAQDALNHQLDQGIPEDVARATLADVGRKHRIYGAETVPTWIIRILRGEVLQAGRLQVERTADRFGHALHIPEMGPLLPTLVDDSLMQAIRITGGDTFSCTSWLLDRRIRSALPASNIAAFAARFTLVEEPAPTAEASAEAARFVFVRPLTDVLDPAKVSPTSRLEHLVADTLRSGANWTEPVGILRTRCVSTVG